MSSPTDTPDKPDTPDEPDTTETSTDRTRASGDGSASADGRPATDGILDRPRRSTRRSLLQGLAAVTAGSVLTTSASASSHDRESVPAPTIEGPIEGQPQTGAVHDLESHGYVEEEYFVSGEARPLGPINPYPEDERENPSDEPASYRTRILVYRPEHRWRFNGTLVVEWPNVSTGRDMPVTWVNTFEYAMREGYAVAVVSAQKVGVDDSPTDQDLATANSDRYGDLHHPGDEFSYDIFAQATGALTADDRDLPPGHASGRANGHARGLFEGRGSGNGRGRGNDSGRGRGNGRGSGGDDDSEDPDPLGGLRVRNTLATGMSQSAHYLRYYVNELQADQGLFDGFMPTVTRYTPEDADDIRDDLVPVMWVMSEDEANLVRREDSGLFRLWEVPGASHVNYWLVRWAQAADARDFGADNPPWDPELAGQYGERADAVYGVCSRNYFPMRYAYRAALDQLQEWVTRGDAPPTAPRIEREVADDGTVSVQTDEYGNALGGLRLPTLDVPVANYDARSCDLYGRTDRLDDETLGELYDSRRDYLRDLGAETWDAVREGYLLPADAKDLLARAQDVDLPSE